MKQIFFLLLISFGATLASYSQPVTNADRIDIALSNNGANGSSAATGATFEVAFRPSIAFPAIPAAEDFIFYLQAPTSILTGAETVTINERSSIFGSTGTVISQGKVEIGTNTYFLFALDAPSGLNLSLLTQNTWRYAFTFTISPAPSASNRALFRIVDRVNNTEISDFAGQTVYSRVMLQNINQLTGSASYLLPLALGEFNVSKQGAGNALLSWTTTSEQNVSHFVIERSNSENSNWTKVGQVPATGNSSTPRSYTFSDINVYDGQASSKVVFYRIRSIDADGREKLFPVRNIRFSAIGGKEVALYPNPAKDGFTVSIPLPQSALSGKVRLNLINRLGQVVNAREISGTVAGNYYYDIKTPGVVSGEYMLQIIFDGELLDTKKVIVQR